VIASQVVPQISTQPAKIETLFKLLRYGKARHDTLARPPPQTQSGCLCLPFCSACAFP